MFISYHYHVVLKDNIFRLYVVTHLPCINVVLPFETNGCERLEPMRFEKPSNESYAARK